MTPKEAIAAKAWDNDGVLNPDDVLEALTAAGYAVVPVKPTEAMLQASPFIDNELTRSAWKEMIAKAQEEGT